MTRNNTSRPPALIGQNFTRRVELRAEAPTDDTDPFSVDVSLSSETPVPRWYGAEILSHDRDAVDLSRFRELGALPVLIDHNTREMVGKVTNLRLEGRKLRGRLTLFDTPRAAEARAWLENDWPGLSVGYIVQSAERTASDDSGDTWTMTAWQPAELSIVPVPADVTIGVGRSAAPSTLSTRSNRNMDPNDENLSRRQRATLESQQHVRVELIENEAERAANITDIATRNDVPHLAAEAIRGGMSVDTFARRVLDEQLRATPSPSRGHSAARELLTGRVGSHGSRGNERRDFSLHAAVNFLLTGQRSQECEVSDDIARVAGRDTAGIYVPLSALTMRTLTSFNTGGAAELVAESQGAVIEALRPASIAIDLGAQVLSGLGGPIFFPKISTPGGANWVQENPGSDAPDTSPGFGGIQLAAKTLHGRSTFSRQLVTATRGAAENIIRSELTAAIGTAIDKAAFNGSGFASQPLGIYGSPDVNTQAMGGAPSYDNLLKLIGKVHDANVPAGGKFGIATTPALASSLARTLEFASSGSRPVWQGKLNDGIAAGYRAMSSNVISSTMSTLAPTGGSQHGLVFGDFSQLLIAFFGTAIELVIDPYTSAARALVNINAFSQVDIGVRHGEAFGVATGATPAA